MKRSVRRRSSLALAIAALLIWTGPISAGIDDSWDWKDQKRTLKIFYDFDEANAKLGDKKLKDIMDEAIANWNAVKAETGWEFVTGGTSGDHDVRIRTAPVPTRVNGAGTTGFPKAGAKSREVTRLTITFDPDYQPGWGVNDDTKKNPIGTAKHELTHVMRLDHQGNIRSVSGKLKDGQGDVTKGDDTTTVTQDDKDEAKKASTAPIKTAAAPGGPGNAATLAVFAYASETPVPIVTPNATLSIPSTAFLSAVDVTLSRTSLYSMPDPFAVPADVDLMIKGVHIDVTGLGGPPQLTSQLFALTIPYEDGVEGPGFLIDLADPEYTAIIESSLRPFLYVPDLQSWARLDPLLLGGFFTLDMTNDVAHLSLPADLLYAFPNTDDPNTGTLFLSLGGTPVPEPSTVVLLVVGTVALLGHPWRRRSGCGAASSAPKRPDHDITENHWDESIPQQLELWPGAEQH